MSGFEHTNLVSHQLPVGPDVEKSTRGIIRPRAEGVSVWEKLDGIDIGLVASEGLDCLAGPHVPQFCESIAGSRDKHIRVRGIYADAHDIAQVVCKLGDFGARLNIPEHASHIPRGSDDFSVVDEATA